MTPEEEHRELMLALLGERMTGMPRWHINPGEQRYDDSEIAVARRRQVLGDCWLATEEAP